MILFLLTSLPFYGSRKSDSLWFRFPLDLLILVFATLAQWEQSPPIISLCEDYFMAAILGCVFIAVREQSDSASEVDHPLFRQRPNAHLLCFVFLILRQFLYLMPKLD